MLRSPIFGLRHRVEPDVHKSASCTYDHINTKMGVIRISPYSDLSAKVQTDPPAGTLRDA